MRSDIAQLAAHGDIPALDAAVSAYIKQSRRDANPRSRRALDWYLNLPHNRRLCAPAWAFLKRHGKITLPVAYLALVCEALLIVRSLR
jgi:hypothetical protein